LVKRRYFEEMKLKAERELQKEWLKVAQKHSESNEKLRRFMLMWPSKLLKFKQMLRQRHLTL